MDKSSPARTQKQMVQAAEAGAKIANMSMQFI